MFKGFRDFILRGNVVDLAVAVVVGAAFTAVVTTFTEGVIQPLVARAGGSTAVGLGFQLGSPGNEATFVDLGALITALINFLITAAIVYFVVVLPVNRLLQLRKAGEQPPPASPAEDTVLLTEIRDLLREQTQHARGPHDS
jgi:large conductance mechanosensitive channel